MKAPLRDYIKVGLVHFMAWPECMGGDGPVLDTMATLAADPFFEVVELTRINSAETRDAVLSTLNEADMEVGFGAQPILLGGNLDLNHADDTQRRAAIDAVKGGVDQASAMGIEAIGLLSGRPSEDKQGAIERLIDSLNDLCSYAAARDCRIVLETFDQLSFGKNCLIGPTVDAVEVSKAVRANHPDFGLLLDLSHLPLIGETSQEAIDAVGEHLVHVHIGNCAMDDPDHPAYGDNHPRFGAPGTRNDVPELTEFLRVLLDSGYLSEEERKIVSFEVKPMPGETAEFVIEDSKRALIEAWEQV